uniref:Uncharacterized protein n=1 Tax=Rhizophora mucronata TaxID=61149 RepID=A0A2P2PTX4_RHIMU
MGYQQNTQRTKLFLVCPTLNHKAMNTHQIQCNKESKFRAKLD